MSLIFFFNDTATTEIYTLSLHDALPIWVAGDSLQPEGRRQSLCSSGSVAGNRAPVHRRRYGDRDGARPAEPRYRRDRKSTRLNSSHANISYAVFCLKKKNQTNDTTYKRI